MTNQASLKYILVVLIVLGVGGWSKAGETPGGPAGDAVSEAINETAGETAGETSGETLNETSAVKAAEATGGMAAALEESLVLLQASGYSYDSLYPWKHEDLEEKVGYGCAVGPYQVLTTAYCVTDAAFIKALRHGQNEYIPAQVKVVDYDSKLALLELDKAAMTAPLVPIKFSEDYTKGAAVDFYRLDRDGQIYSGRGYIDRVKLYQSTLSYANFLNYVIGNISQQAGLGNLFCRGDKFIGIGCWYNNSRNESGVVPAVVINHFLADAARSRYLGFPAVGFAAGELLDPAVRAYLKMPPEQKDGIYVSDVYTIGTGSDALKSQDVILAIDGVTIDAHGFYRDEKYDWLSFEHLINMKQISQTITFDIWRGGEKQQISAQTKNFPASEMLVPYYEYNRQPQYLVTGGFIFQQLTRKYLSRWGDNWDGKVSAHLYHYCRDLAFKPSGDQREVVILSRVLPADINLGYQNLNQLVVKSFNGKAIGSMADILAAQKLNPESKFDIVEFENDNPTVVIPRDKLAMADALIARRYGIDKLFNVNQ